MKNQSDSGQGANFSKSQPPLYLLHGIKSDGRWQKLIPSFMSPLFRCIPLTYREYHFLGAAKIIFWPWAIAFGLMLLFSNESMHKYEWVNVHVGIATCLLVIVAEITWATSHNSRASYQAKDSRAKFIYLLHTFAFVAATSLLALLIFIQGDNLSNNSKSIVIYCYIAIVMLETRESLNSLLSIGFMQRSLWTNPVKSSVYHIIILLLLGFSIIYINKFSGLTLCLFSQAVLWIFATTIEPKLRTQRVVSKVSAQIRWNRNVADERPSLIAHSYGTKIIADVLESSPGITIDKLILVGCVLPSDYDWTNLLNDTHIILGDVRNEYGRKDIVVRWLAWIIGYLGTGLGRAGYTGFSSACDMVHQVPGPLSSCKRCTAKKQKAVHNVALKKYGHNDWFLEIDHARDLWVPYLFEIDPVHYHNFHDLCKRGANAIRTQDWGAYNVVEIELRETRWLFEPHKKTGSYLSELISTDLRLACPQFSHRSKKFQSLAQEVEATVVLIIILEVVQACVESEGGPDKNSELIQWSLNPRKAVTRAVNNRVTLLRESNHI